MKKVFKTVVAGIVLTATAGMAAAETKLTLSSWLPPTHPIVTDMIQPCSQS